MLGQRTTKTAIAAGICLQQDKITQIFIILFDVDQCALFPTTYQFSRKCKNLCAIFRLVNDTCKYYRRYR